MMHIKSRLRQGEITAGYKEWRGEWMYSKDGKDWSEKQILCNNQDRYAGVDDEDENELYVGDVVRHEDSGPDGIKSISFFTIAVNDGGECFLESHDDTEYNADIYTYPVKRIGNIFANPNIAHIDGYDEKN